MEGNGKRKNMKHCGGEMQFAGFVPYPRCTSPRHQTAGGPEKETCKKMGVVGGGQCCAQESYRVPGVPVPVSMIVDAPTHTNPKRNIGRGKCCVRGSYQVPGVPVPVVKLQVAGSRAVPGYLHVAQMQRDVHDVLHGVMPSTAFAHHCVLGRVVAHLERKLKQVTLGP
jgi:hypothetical protein